MMQLIRHGVTHRFKSYYYLLLTENQWFHFFRLLACSERNCNVSR